MQDARLQSSKLGGVAHEPKSQQPRAPDEDEERWAASLGQTVARVLARSAPDPTSQSPADWRSIDSPLTRVSSAPAGVQTRGATPEGDTGGRFALRVDAGDLGELSLVVDRAKGGTRVVIGTSDDRTLSAVEPERAALERALVASGVTVDSVRVVRLTGVGTGLATGKAEGSPHRGHPTQRKQFSPQPRKRTRRLNLVG